MAYRTKLLYFLLISIGEIQAKPTEFYLSLSNSKQENETFEIDKDDYPYNVTEKDVNTIEVNTIEVNTLIDTSKCETNTSFEEAPYTDIKMLDSVYLNNIYSSVTTNLIEENLSIENLELDGLDLYEVVGRDCGAAKICPSMTENWRHNKTITIGFLGAYRRSQVSVCFINVIVLSAFDTCLLKTVSTRVNTRILCS